MYRDYEILSSLNHKRHYIKTIVIVQVTLALDRGEWRQLYTLEKTPTLAVPLE